MTTLNEFRWRIYEDLRVLQEREAKYGGNTPIELINQINDHTRAIDLIEQADPSDSTEITIQELKRMLRPLLIDRNLVDSLEPEIPRLPYEPETILIPAGRFLMGSPVGKNESKWESPQCEVDLPAYQIGKYPVTNEQYAEFIRQTGRLVAPESSWEGQKPPDDRLRYPIMGLTWYDALAYCEWLSEKTKRSYTLPSEAQWEKAARGTNGRIYPWGNEWQAHRCNHGSKEIQPVDAFLPQSEYGCYDLVGNVREWTSTLWGERLIAPDPDFRYPWIDDGRRDDLSAKSHFLRVYRGGAFSDPISHLRCSARNAFHPKKTGLPNKRHGFRVVLK